MTSIESFGKRKTNDEVENVENKKARKEICPHKINCYRRNPHHFFEYDHPHLTEIIKTKVPIPDNWPQSKSVYTEQIQILSNLLKSNTNENTPLTRIQASGLDSSSSSTEASSSKSISKNGKATSYIPNVKNFKNENIKVSTSSKNMADKLRQNAPYNLFFTAIPDSSPTLNQSNSITFTDLLCPSLGELKCSLQINFMIDIAWLMEQYLKAGQGKKPLTILYGDEFPDMKKYIEIMLPNVTEHHVKMKDPFGVHHTKIGMYVYSDKSIRIVVSTANLYFEDWNYYCQGLWISPTLPPLPEGSSDTAGESPTKFKSNFVSYLKTYNLPVLKEWLDYAKRADFSSIKVFFVSSTPGKHERSSIHSHLQQVGSILSSHCTLPPKITAKSEGPLAWGIISQASSIGSLGKTPGEWLRTGLLRSLASHKDHPLPANSNANLKVVFPTQNNVLGSYYGPLGGGCLPYSKATHEKQKWLKDYLHCWKADDTARSRAMPHIKTYCRISPCLTQLAWFLITSANISKSAWGGNITKGGTSYVRSYEAGVLFIPKFFDEDCFKIKGNDEKLFPFIYDLPLTSYKSDDEPWCN